MLPVAMSLTWFLFAFCLLMGMGAWFIFARAVRRGMFRNTEQIAEDMLVLDRVDTTAGVEAFLDQRAGEDDGPGDRDGPGGGGDPTPGLAPTGPATATTLDVGVPSSAGRQSTRSAR